MPSFDAQLAQLIADTLHVPLRIASALSDGLQVGVLATVVGGIYLIKTKGSVRAALRDRRISTPRSREMIWPGSPSEGLLRASNALAAIGTVAEETMMRVSGSVRFGVVSTRVTVTVTPSPEGSTVEMRAEGGDGLGRASRSALARLEDAILNLDQPGFTPNREGISPAAHILQVAGLAVLMFGTLWLLLISHVFTPSR